MPGLPSKPMGSRRPVIGSKKKLISANSIEENIQDLLDSKSDLFSIVVEGAEVSSSSKSITESDLFSILGIQE